MSLVKKVGIGFGIFVVIGLVGRAGKDSAGSATAASADYAATVTERASAPPEPPIWVSAVDLFRAYDKNEVAADDSYKGRKILLSGRLESIDKDMFSNIVLHISTGQMFAGILATVQDSQKSTAAGLSKRQEVTVLCRGAGMVLRSPMLQDCLVQ